MKETFVRKSSLTAMCLLALLALTLAPGAARPARAATCTVTSSAFTGPGTLTALLGDPNCDRITFSRDLTITFTTLYYPFMITRSVIVDGGPYQVIISGASASGDNAALLGVGPGADVTLKNLTLANGLSPWGGALYNEGGLTVINSTLIGNEASSGGAIFTGGTLTVINSTFSGNHCVGLGGAIWGLNSTTVINSTFIGNTADQQGGALWGGRVTNSTFYNNSAPEGASVYSTQWEFFNNILVGSGRGTNCYFPEGSGTAANNLADDDSCGPGFTRSDSILLGPLGNYGGRTQTLPLLPGSAAIDTGSSLFCPLADQRGQLRPQGAGCDIGAYEVGLMPPVYIAVSAGYEHTCGLKTDGSVVCWGDNRYGETTPQADGFRQVSAGEELSCAVTGYGSAVCWGWDGAGQTTPPGGLFTQVSAGRDHVCGLISGGTLVCWGNNFYGEAPPQVAGPFTQISVGEDHTCAVRSGPEAETGGDIACWGWNLYGEAPPQLTGPFTQVSAGRYHTCGLKTDGSIECWGDSLYGQAPPQVAGPFSQVSAGRYHTCGLKTNGNVVCWGSNSHGQATAQTGPFVQVSAGWGHTCGVKSNGTVACWGNNWWGQSQPPLGGPTPTFDFSGYYRPVEPAPALNTANAGSAIPLKFGLGGDQGLEILAEGYPASLPVACDTLQPAGALAPTDPAGRSGLSYDPETGRYQYVWKTDRAWAGTCRVLLIRLSDDTWHPAVFRFQ